MSSDGPSREPPHYYVHTRNRRPRVVPLSVLPPYSSSPQLPEMLRVSLDDMVLQILLLDKGDPAEFLASAVNPPTELAVANSIKYLCELQVRLSLFLSRGVLVFCGGRALNYVVAFVCPSSCVTS